MYIKYRMKRVERTNICRTVRVHYSFILSPVSIRTGCDKCEIAVLFLPFDNIMDNVLNQLHVNFISLLKHSQIINKYSLRYLSSYHIEFIIIPFIEIYLNKSSLMI